MQKLYKADKQTHNSQQQANELQLGHSHEFLVFDFMTCLLHLMHNINMTKSNCDFEIL